jgi:serine/threonine protein phosphatase PrpC
MPMGFSVASRTHVGLVRKLNEDALLAVPGQTLWAVADGMGGHDAGEVASAMVVQALAALAPGPDAQGVAALAIGALQDVNARLLEISRREFHNRTIGSTVAALAADGASYACFWAGDSRAYRVRAGEAEQLTRDHSLVQDLVDAGILSSAEAENHPNSNVITRAVGVDDKLRIDSVSGDLAPGDIFLIASDGLTRHADAARIAAELAGAEPEAAADRLLALALAEGASDNVTFAIIRFDGPPA